LSRFNTIGQPLDTSATSKQTERFELMRTDAKTIARYGSDHLSRFTAAQGSVER